MAWIDNDPNGLATMKEASEEESDPKDSMITNVVLREKDESVDDGSCGSAMPAQQRELCHKKTGSMNWQRRRRRRQRTRKRKRRRDRGVGIRRSLFITSLVISLVVKSKVKNQELV